MCTHCRAREAEWPIPLLQDDSLILFSSLPLRASLSALEGVRRYAHEIRSIKSLIAGTQQEQTGQNNRAVRCSNTSSTLPSCRESCAASPLKSMSSFLGYISVVFCVVCVGIASIDVSAQSRLCLWLKLTNPRPSSCLKHVLLFLRFGSQ